MRVLMFVVLCSLAWAQQQPRTLVDVALRAAEDGDMTSAVRILETVVTADDRDARAWALLGNLLNARERYADGAQALRRALEINPADARAQFDLGVSCFHLGRIDEARAQFDKTLAAAPKDPDALWMRGQVAMREKDLDRAIACFRAAAEAPETRYKAAGRLHEGMALAWKGENDKAIEALRAAAEAEPEGTAGLLASLLAGRLGGGPPETLLNPEEYVARDGGCEVHAVDATSLDVNEAIELGRYRMGADLALVAERQAGPLVPCVVVRLADLAALQARASGREARFLVRADADRAKRAEVFFLAPTAAPPSETLSPCVAAIDAAWKAAEAVLELGKTDGRLEDVLSAGGAPLREAMKREWWNDLLEALARDEEESAAIAAEAGATDPRRHAELAKLIRLLATAVPSEAKAASDAVGKYSRTAQEAIAAGRFDLAATLYRMGLLHRTDGTGMRDLLASGLAASLAAQGRHQAARRASGNPFLEGRSLLLTGRLDDAAVALKTHVEQHAESAEGRELLGLCRAWSGRWAEAEEALSKVSPKTPLARFYLGYAAWYRGDRDSARVEWAACAKEAPGSFHGLLALGLSTPRAAASSSTAAVAAAERLRAAWRPLARMPGIELGRAAGAFTEWLDAAQPLGLTLGAFEKTLTPDLRARCGTPAAASFLDEALSQAEEDAKGGKDEEAAARVGLLRLMKQALTSTPR